MGDFMSNIKVVTYNIRNVMIGDGINGFIHREGMAVAKIKKELPDVVCIQEGMPEIISALKNALTEYTFIFNGRNADFGGEGLCVAFRNATIELCGLDCFWHSKTPYIPESKDKESGCPRICQRALLKHLESSKLFTFYNVHLDYLTPEIRLVQTEELFERIVEADERYNTPFFVLGDFNARPHEPTIDYFNNKAPLKMNDLTKDFEFTFHGYGNFEKKCKIDYIYYHTGDEYTYTAELWDDEIDGIYLSDHYPICVNIEF